MTITSISYKQKFATFQFLNCDIGFDGSLGDNENPLEALKKLKTIAEVFHKQEFPHMYELVDHQPLIDYIIKPHDDEKQPEPDKIKAFIELINSKYQTSKTLESLRAKVEKENNPQLQEAFDNKLRTLEISV